MTSDAFRLRVYDALVARIYVDRRLPVGTREAALAMAWTWHRHPGTPAGPDTDLFWERLTDVLGPGDYRGSRVGTLLAEDAPRYEPPRNVWVHSGACEGPRLRPYRRRNPAPNPDCVIHVAPGYVEPAPRDNRICGANATIRVVEHDMITGWVRARWFCRRHAGRAEEVRAQIEAMGAPPAPIPNAGGLLPRYFTADWTAIYARYRPGWRPPYHGVCADDWPSPKDRHRVPRPPRLSVVT